MPSVRCRFSLLHRFFFGTAHSAPSGHLRVDLWQPTGTGKILEQLRYLIDPTAIQVIQDIANHAAKPRSRVFATLVGIVIALFGASGIFGQPQDALNTIWSVKPKPGQGIWSFIRARFLSFGMVAGVCFLYH